jgi:hypothetical protein
MVLNFITAAATTTTNSVFTSVRTNSSALRKMSQAQWCKVVIVAVREVVIVAVVILVIAIEVV